MMMTDTERDSGFGAKTSANEGDVSLVFALFQWAGRSRDLSRGVDSAVGVKVVELPMS